MVRLTHRPTRCHKSKPPIEEKEAEGREEAIELVGNFEHSQKWFYPNKAHIVGIPGERGEELRTDNKPELNQIQMRIF